MPPTRAPSTDTIPRDTTVRVAPPDSARADSARARRDTTPNPFGDLDLQFQGRLEPKLERIHNDRCVTGVAALAFTCRADWINTIDFQFNMKSAGAVADVLHVNVDYDSQREFQGSNTIALRRRVHPTILP